MGDPRCEFLPGHRSKFSRWPLRFPRVLDLLIAQTLASLTGLGSELGQRPHSRSCRALSSLTATKLCDSSCIRVLAGKKSGLKFRIHTATSPCSSAPRTLRAELPLPT